MTRGVVFTPGAERQLEALYRYIETKSGTARAEGFTSRIVGYCNGLGRFPERGTRRDDIRPGLRTIGFRRRATIAFMVDPDAVVIVGVFYAGQEYEARLRAGT